MPTVADLATIGILPAQHHDENFGPHIKHGLVAARVIRRTPRGKYVFERKTKAPVQGTVFWPHEDEGGRKVGAWGISGFAAVMDGQPEDADDNADGAGGSPQVGIAGSLEELTGLAGVGIGAQAGFNFGNGEISPLFGGPEGQQALIDGALSDPAIGPQNDPALGSPAGGANDGSDQATPGGGNPRCKSSPSRGAVLPIGDADYGPDGRFKRKTVSYPKQNGNPVWKLPGGTIGVLRATTEDDVQTDLFLPTDWRLVAVNYAGDHLMGSPVYDLDGDSKMDPERWAPLQSALRVVKKPNGKPNVLSFQLGPTGCGDTQGGYFTDKSASSGAPTGGGPAGTDVPIGEIGVGGGPGSTVVGPAGGLDFVHGLGSVNDGGPFDVGSGKCKHAKGEDADGIPISSLHISDKALFRRNDSEDGPFFFEGNYQDGDDSNHKMRVHLTWDGGSRKWRWFTSTYVFPSLTTVPGFPMDPTDGPVEITHDEFVPGDTPSIDPGGGGGFPFTDLFTPVELTPSQDPRGSSAGDVTGEPARNVGDGTNPGSAEPGSRIGEENERPGPGEEFRGYTPDLRPIFGPEQAAPAFGSGGTALDEAHLASMQEMSMPGVLAKPESTNTTKLALANLFGSEAAPAAMEQFNQTPITGNMMAFGAEGGPEQGVYGNTEHGGSYDPWDFTELPGNSRYREGTAKGGWIIVPPEVKMADHAEGFAPNGLTVSDTYFLVGPNAYFGAGIFEKSKAGLQDGWVWGMDTTTGDLIFYSHINSADRDAGICFDLSGQNIAWRSNTDFYGTLDHAITAARTWTFPDISGTVTTTGTASGLFTQGSVLFADANGQIAQDNSNLFWDDTNNRLGIGTTGPDAKLDVLSTSTQLRLTYTDGAVYASQTVNSSGHLILTSTGARIGIEESSPTDTLHITLPTVSSNSYVKIGSASEADFSMRLGTSTTSQYAWFTNAYYDGSAWQKDQAAVGGWRLNMACEAADADSAMQFTYFLAGGVTNNRPFEIKGDGTVLVAVGNLGVGTSGPDAKIDSLSTSGAQYRATYTDGSVYCDFTVDSGGDLTIAPTGNDVSIDGNSLSVGTNPAASGAFRLPNNTSILFRNAGDTGDVLALTVTSGNILYVGSSGTYNVMIQGSSAGELGFFGTTPSSRAPAYTPTNVTTDRSYDANGTSVAELADVLGTLIADLQSYGLLQ